MQVGDLVIYPYKPDSTLSFGRIESDYYFEPDVQLHPNRRKVAWSKTGVPRAQFSKSARYEVGSAVTLFRVKTHETEFVSFVEGAPPAAGPNGAGSTSSPTTTHAIAVPPDQAAAQAEDEPNAERIETYTRDFIIETLLKELEGFRFEYFVAHLLEAMGYRTQVTQAVGDGGFDIIAHRDPLAWSRPSSRSNANGRSPASAPPMSRSSPARWLPAAQNLGYSSRWGPTRRMLSISDARVRTCAWSTAVELIFEHYESFNPEWKRLLPLRRVYVVDREPEAN